jgi:hypothetical protein
MTRAVKELPHPQEASLLGFDPTTKALRMSESSHSILDPRMSPKLTLSHTT